MHLRAFFVVLAVLMAAGCTGEVRSPPAPGAASPGGAAEASSEPQPDAPPSDVASRGDADVVGGEVGPGDGPPASPHLPPPSTGTSAPKPQRFIVYLHGRGSQRWNPDVVAKVSGWTDVTLGYDGSARLDDAAITSLIEGTLVRYCTATNACVISCHSAGCMRTLLAVDTLQAKGTPLNLLWVQAAASAAGGTRLAEVSTNLVGDEPIDEDLRRDRARAATGWGPIQDAMTSSTMYHLAGGKDSCAAPGVCGNLLLPSGVCDGLVCVDSAGGASVSGSFDEGCDVPKYPGRVYDRKSSPCGGLALNHTEMGHEGARVAASALATQR